MPSPFQFAAQVAAKAPGMAGAVKPMASGKVSPGLLDGAKFVPPPKQDAQYQKPQFPGGSGNWTQQGGITTSINGKAVPLNAEQQKYISGINDVRRMMDSSNLVGDDAPPPAPTPRPQSMLSMSRPAAPPTPRSAPAPQPARPQQPSLFQKSKSFMPGTSAWTGQTNAPGPLTAPMTSVSNSFNNATGQQDPAHIITTDNGRKFNTQTKTFLDGQPGGFAR